MEHRRLVDEAKNARTDDHSSQELTEYGRLSEASRGFSEELRGEPHDNEAEKKFARFHVGLR